MNIELNKIVLKYVNLFGKDLINELIAIIKKENWVRTGSLIRSLEFSSSEFENKLVGMLNVAGYAQYLEEGRAKANKLQIKAQVNLPVSQPIQSKLINQGLKLDIKNSGFVGKNTQKLISNFGRKYSKGIEQDLAKQIQNKLQIEANKIKNR